MDTLSRQEEHIPVDDNNNQRMTQKFQILVPFMEVRIPPEDKEEVRRMVCFAITTIEDTLSEHLLIIKEL